MARFQRQLGDPVGEAQKVVVLGDEIGLAVDFDQYGVSFVAGSDDRALGGHAPGLLVGLRQATLAQVLDGRVQVAVGLDQRLLAFHHAGAGALAEFLDQGCSDAHDSSLLSDSLSAASSAAFSFTGASAGASAFASAFASAGASAFASAGSSAFASAGASSALAAAFLAAFFAVFLATFLATFLVVFLATFLAVFFLAGAADSTGLPSASSSTNSSSSPPTCGTEALPSSTASAASWAYRRTERIASSLPGMT